MPKASWNGAVIAESDRTVIVENNHYFPAGAVKREHLRDSDHHTTCGWKGVASYYHVVVDGKTIENAAWYYPQTEAEAMNIEGHIAFWKGVQVEP